MHTYVQNKSSALEIRCVQNVIRCQKHTDLFVCCRMSYSRLFISCTDTTFSPSHDIYGSSSESSYSCQSLLWYPSLRAYLKDQWPSLQVLSESSMSLYNDGVENRIQVRFMQLHNVDWLYMRWRKVIFYQQWFIYWLWILNAFCKLSFYQILLCV
jgi:hypothetical protein